MLLCSIYIKVKGYHTIFSNSQPLIVIHFLRPCTMAQCPMTLLPLIKQQVFDCWQEKTHFKHMLEGLFLIHFQVLSQIQGTFTAFYSTAAQHKQILWLQFNIHLQHGRLICATFFKRHRKMTYLFWARLILHSCQTRSTTWLASRRGILPPWWLVLSTLNASDDEGILTHFWAEWESTGEGKIKVNFFDLIFIRMIRYWFMNSPVIYIYIVFTPVPVCASSGDVGGVRVTKDMAGSRWEAGTWWPPE